MTHPPSEPRPRSTASGPLPDRGPSRRRLLGGAALVTAGLLTRAWPAAAVTQHPSALHTAGDLARMTSVVNAGLQPWRDGWSKLLANSHAQSGWTPNPQTTVYRGSASSDNYGTLYHDIAAAYQNALRWKISQNTACGQTAANILNAWAHTLTKIDGSADRFLAAGIYGYQFANAGELMRGHSAFDLTAFKNMMRVVFYPLNDSFLDNHNGAYITNYWAGWDLCNMASVLAIGILCDDDTLVTRAVDYFHDGAGNGSLNNAVPYVYDSQGLAQWQESGRDQGHTALGIGLMSTVCEMAWNQGYDLYGAGNNRFLKACEYVAKYNLGYDVPFTALHRPRRSARCLGALGRVRHDRRRRSWLRPPGLGVDLQPLCGPQGALGALHRAVRVPEPGRGRRRRLRPQQRRLRPSWLRHAHRDPRQGNDHGRRLHLHQRVQRQEPRQRQHVVGGRPDHAVDREQRRRLPALAPDRRG